MTYLIFEGLSIAGVKNSLGCCHSVFQLGWQNDKSLHVKYITKLIIKLQYKKWELKGGGIKRPDIRAE